MTTTDRTTVPDHLFREHLAQWEAASAAFAESTVDQLYRSHFGACVSIPERGCSGYLYAVHDSFNDAYPDRLIVLIGNDGDDAHELRFTDSDPAGYPKTMGTRCLIEAEAMRGPAATPEEVARTLRLAAAEAKAAHSDPDRRC